MTRRILLNAFDMGCVGHQSAGLWRHPSDEGHRYTDLDHWTSLARMLEDGGFDALFLADVLGVYDVYGGSRDAAVRAAAQVPLVDPLLLVPAMAGATSRLGFGVTVSVAYEHPYALARRFATLDHLSNGRVAWNVVTSYLDSAARNLGRSGQIPHDERYELAEEFLQVCYKLWEGSWEDDAVVRDRERGVFTDPSRVHDIGHHGQWFDVPGPFLSEPSPQRTPVIFQAGASPRGARFAGTHAEAVFVSGPSPAVVRRSVDAIRAEAERAGRDPRSVKIFAMLTAIAGETDEAARATLEEYLALTDPQAALALFGGWSGVDLSGAAAGEKLEYVQTESTRSALASFTGPDRDWTVGELAEFITVGGRGPVIVGSGATVADELERWADEADLDGFNLAYAVTPGTMADVVTHVVPELRRRGRVPAPGDAGGATLREQYGTGDGPRLAKEHPGAGYRTLGA